MKEWIFILLVFATGYATCYWTHRRVINRYRKGFPEIEVPKLVAGPEVGKDEFDLSVTHQLVRTWADNEINTLRDVGVDNDWVRGYIVGTNVTSIMYSQTWQKILKNRKETEDTQQST